MADVLEQFLSGGQTNQPAKGASVITDQLLDSLRRVESGKDRFAINKETKAMGPYQFMPETVQMLHKQGIEFNPFNEQQAREAAKTYLGQLVERNKGDVNKALAQYGGFVTKDPSKYVSNVLGGAKETPQAAPVASTGDPLEAFLSGKPVAQPSQPNQPSQPTALSTTSTQEGTMGEYVPRRQPVGQMRQLVGKFLKGALETKQEMPERVAGAIDTLYGVVPATYGAAVQALARTAQSPERAEQTGQAAAASIDKPVGKFFGLTGKETYQKPLGGVTEPIVEQVKKMAEQLGMTPKQISEKTGIPEQDIKNMVVIGSVAVPQAIKEVAPVVKEIGPAVKQAAQTTAERVRKELGVGEIELVKPGQLTKEQAQAQFEAKQAPAGSAGAAAAANNPFAGKITGEETVRGQFPQIKLSKTPTDVPVNEQILRSQAVQEVMPGVGVRPGVVTGNENLLRNEHTKAKLDTPEGQLFKQQIANEQIALSKYADERVDATGASRTLINDEQRGGRINDVLYGTSPDDMASSSIMGYLNQAKKQVYDSAYKRVGGNQIKTTNVDDLLKNPQWAAGLKIKGVEGVQSAAKDYLNLAKTVGFEDINGVMHPPGSVAAYDAVRKAINADWTPQNANAIRRVNQAIDKDIAAVADPALYKLGDRIHEVEKTIFGSKGIKTLFGEMDKNGVITSSTPLEKIPSKMNNLPKDQWRHIRETLNDLANGNVKGAPEGMPPVPQELRQSAAAAVAEIDGALAREVQKAGSDKMGVWNQNSANKTMNSLVGEKILETFPPDEVRRFHLLNTVGQIVPGIHAYEGAALQARRVGVIEGNLPKIGAGAGAALGGFVGEAPGAAVGTYLGQQAGAKYKAKIEEKALTKEAKKSQKEMEKATALGKQTGKNKLEDLNK
jgi:hypothetical protein